MSCCVAAAAAAAEPAAPFSLELEFKKPTLLPNRLGLTGGADYSKAAAAGERGTEPPPSHSLLSPTASSPVLACHGWLAGWNVCSDATQPQSTGSIVSVHCIAYAVDVLSSAADRDPVTMVCRCS